MIMKLSAVAKKMMLIIALLTAVFIVAGIILCFALAALGTAEILPVSLGILLSSIISIIKVFLLQYQVSRLGNMEDPNKARFFAVGHGFIRFILTGGGLVAAHFIPFTNLIAAIAGAFIYNIAVYILRFVKLDEEADEE